MDRDINGILGYGCGLLTFLRLTATHLLSGIIQIHTHIIVNTLLLYFYFLPRSELILRI